jgi:hypothetical protein
VLVLYMCRELASLSKRGEQEREKTPVSRFGRKLGRVQRKALSRRFAGGGAFHGSQESSEFTVGAPLAVWLQIHPPVA